MYSYNLFNSISSDLKINKDSSESEEEWKKRLIYSAVGKVSLASFWDQEDLLDSEREKKGVSVKRYKSLIAQRFEAYYQISGIEMDPVLFRPNDIANEIYEIYSVTGFFYHEPNWIVPSMKRTAVYDNVRFIRDCDPATKLSVSGLGFYINDAFVDADSDLYDIFNLPQKPYVEWLKAYMSFCQWKPVNLPQDTEYLRIEPPFTRGYWVRNSTVKEKDILLCRYGFTGQQIYYLLRRSGNMLFGSQLPEWMVGLNGRSFEYTSHEYFRVALSILMMKETLPPIRVQKGETLFRIELPYLLPTQEEMFFKLYSWPWSTKNETSSMFVRTMNPTVFNCFRELMQFYGFSFSHI